MSVSGGTDAAPTASARERIVATAYELFTDRGVRAVGIDKVIARAKVAKATLYHHFPTKDALLLEVLRRREQLWTYDQIEAQSRGRADTPEEQLLAIFDVLDESQRDKHDSCSFVKVLLEMGPTHPAGQASIEHMATFRAIVRQRAQAAGLLYIDDFARSFDILRKGAMISAAEGDLQAAHRAKIMARALIDGHRPVSRSQYE